MTARSLPRDRRAIAALLPHGESMCLLRAVEDCGAHTISCQGMAADDPAHPLLGAAGVAAIHAIEYAAQAAALHGALTTARAGRPGMLAAVRDLRWSGGARLASGTPRVECEAEVVDARLCRYAFSFVDGAGARVAGRVTVAFGEPGR